MERSTQQMSSLRGIVLLVGLLAASVAFSQTSTATLTGTVRDSTGAILPSVAVTVTNTDRNVSQMIVTNDAGNYVFPALIPGAYSVSAELPAFKKFVRDGITLQ